MAVRLTPEAKRILEHAAEISGRTLSDFVIEAALAEAHQRIDAHTRLQLAEADRVAFLTAIASPLAPSPALREAAEIYRLRDD